MEQNRITSRLESPRHRTISGFLKCSAILFLMVLAIAACDKKKVKDSTLRLPPGTKPETVMEKGEKYFRKHQYKEAAEQFLAVRNNFPSSDWASQAHLRAAETYYAWKQYDDAANTFADFRKLHPLHPKADFSYFKQGESLFKEAPKAIDRDQTACRQVVSVLGGFLAKYSDSEYRGPAQDIFNTCRQRLAGQEFFIGRFYYRRGKYKAAAVRLKGLLDRYGGAGYDDKGRYYLGLSLLKLDDKQSAHTIFNELIEKFPSSRYSGKAKEKLRS